MKRAPSVRRLLDLLGKAWRMSLELAESPSQILFIARSVASGAHLGELLKLNQVWLRQSGIKTVIDVGAGTGQFASAIHSVLPDSTIYCFEPLIESCESLRRRLRRSSAVKVFHTALGEQKGTCRFWRSSFPESSSLLKMSDLHRQAFPWTSENEEIMVQVNRLDDFVGDIQWNPKALLKIDVQGAERAVLHGGVEALSRVDYILVEVSFCSLYEGQPLFEDTHRDLVASGFRYKGSMGPLFSPLNGAILQADALYQRDGQDSS